MKIDFVELKFDFVDLKILLIDFVELKFGCADLKTDFVELKVLSKKGNFVVHPLSQEVKSTCITNVMMPEYKNLQPLQM